jgi:hypothetical protein
VQCDCVRTCVCVCVCARARAYSSDCANPDAYRLAIESTASSQPCDLAFYAVSVGRSACILKHLLWEHFAAYYLQHDTIYIALQFSVFLSANMLPYSVMSCCRAAV